MSDYVKEVAILTLGLMCIAAMHYGYNGPILVGISGAVAGLGGYHIRGRVNSMCSNNAGKPRRTALDP